MFSNKFVGAGLGNHKVFGELSGRVVLLIGLFDDFFFKIVYCGIKGKNLAGQFVISFVNDIEKVFGQHGSFDDHGIGGNNKPFHCMF